MRSDRRGGVCVAEFTVLGGFGTVSLGSVATVWECGVMYLFRLGNLVWKCDAAVGIRDRGAVLMVITCFLSTIERTVWEGHGAFFLYLSVASLVSSFRTNMDVLVISVKLQVVGKGDLACEGMLGP